MNDAASQTSQSYVQSCVSRVNGAYGIDCNSGRIQMAHNRIYNNTSGAVLDNLNYARLGEDTQVITEANEFVDYANDDFRIKNSAATWGQGFGAGDGPAAGGGSPGNMEGGLQ